MSCVRRCLRAGPRWQMIEIFPGAGVLRRAPLLDLGSVPVFQPAIVLGDFHAVVKVGDRMLWSGLEEERR